MKRAVPFAMLLLAFAATAAPDVPRIAVIIDDIGDRYVEGEAAVRLPGPVALAFLPHTPHARRLAELAFQARKEVLLHLPLQAMEDKLPGPGAITLDTTEGEFRRLLEENLAAVPHAGGVNNHMGSLITRHPGHMTWLMQELSRDGLFFVDSYTHPQSVALQMARERGVPAARRDVFLDHVAEPEAIAFQFRRLVERAKRNGQAIGIGHPYAETLAFLETALPALEAEYGVRLVPVSELLEQPQPAVPAP